MASCVFCDIVDGKQQAAKIWEDGQFLAFLDIKPVKPGHTLVIPKAHVDYIFDLEEPLYSGMFRIAKKISQHIEKVTKPKRVGLGIEGFGVPHAHIHLIPVNKANDLDPCMAKPAHPADLSDMQKKIRREIEKGP